jgi:hypothetical protein
MLILPSGHFVEPIEPLEFAIWPLVGKLAGEI